MEFILQAIIPNHNPIIEVKTISCGTICANPNISDEIAIDKAGASLFSRPLCKNPRYTISSTKPGARATTRINTIPQLVVNCSRN